MAPRSRPVDVAVPGDKSISHRALLLAALASGESRITGLLDAADTRATAAALSTLGFAVPTALSGEIRLLGRGVGAFRGRDLAMDCANSGTTARLLLGALAGSDVEAVLTGDASLRRRPMRRVTTPLSGAGAVFEELGEDDGLPIRVRGRSPLRPIRADNPRSSAQVKSALLLAGLTGRAPVEVRSPLPSRDHTERMLRAMGAPLRVQRRPPGSSATGDGGEVGERVVAGVAESLSPLDLRVPGDASAAAFFVAYGVLAGAIRIGGVDLNPGRTGALDVLRAMGGRVAAQVTGEAAGEPVGEIMAAPGDGLRGVVVAPEQVPSLLDEVPVLAVVASAAEGETRFEGVAELRVKESDRVAAVCANLRKLGVEAVEEADALTVVGRPGAMLRGEVDAGGDHRIAMAFGVLGAVAGNEIVVAGSDAVAISYPGFWRTLEGARREMEEC